VGEVHIAVVACQEFSMSCEELWMRLQRSWNTLYREAGDLQKTIVRVSRCMKSCVKNRTYISAFLRTLCLNNLTVVESLPTLSQDSRVPFAMEARDPLFNSHAIQANPQATSNL